VNVWGYALNNPILHNDPSGLYVGGVGGFAGGAVSGEAIPGGYVAGSASLVWDSHGNLGWAVCGSVGVASGGGAIGGLSVTNAWGAETICDLEGVGIGIGAGGAGAAGAAGWGGYVEGNTSGVATGVGYGIGGWAGAVGAGGCKVYPAFPGRPLKCRKSVNCNK